MTPTETATLATIVYLLTQFVKRVLRSTGSLVYVIVLLLAVGLAEINMIVNAPGHLTGAMVLNAFFTGVLAASSAIGIHGISAQTRAESGDSDSDTAALVASAHGALASATTDVAAAGAALKDILSTAKPVSAVAATTYIGPAGAIGGDATEENRRLEQAIQDAATLRPGSA
jgi:hypothetical protein